jgi:uncharacterized membrane protein
MNLPADLLSPSWLWGGHVAYFSLLALASFRAPWSRLNDPRTLNVFLGSCVALIALWHMEAGVLPGLHYHLLGATALTLMFGWPLGLLGMALVLVATTGNGLGAWETLSINGLLGTALPVGVTHLVLRASERWLPPNFFVYVFVNGFFGAGLAISATAITATLLLMMSGAYPIHQLAASYLSYLPLVAFPEAWVNGIVITMLVGLRPEWVCTFQDSRYLDGR